MNVAVLTDNSSAATTTMQAISSASKVHAFSAHTLWIMSNAADTDVANVQNASWCYASVVLPNPL